MWVVVEVQGHLSAAAACWCCLVGLLLGCPAAYRCRCCLTVLLLDGAAWRRGLVSLLLA